MTDSSRLVPWLQMALLTVVAAGAAVVGLVMAPSTATLHAAITNTLAAPNYTSVYTIHRTGTAPEVQTLVWQAPDRLGGYVDTANGRVYVAVIGSYEYQSATVSRTRSTAHLTFIKEASQPAKAYDPVQSVLPTLDQLTDVHTSGNVTTGTYVNGGQDVHITVTVDGQYVSKVAYTTTGGSGVLEISQVGTSPPVALPSGATVKSLPTGAGTP